MTKPPFGMVKQKLAHVGFKPKHANRFAFFKKINSGFYDTGADSAIAKNIKMFAIGDFLCRSLFTDNALFRDDVIPGI
jgi:hypothetical protein